MNLFTLLFPNLPPVRLPVHHDIEDIQALKVENLLVFFQNDFRFSALLHFFLQIFRHADGHFLLDALVERDECFRRIHTRDTLNLSVQQVH